MKQEHIAVPAHVLGGVASDVDSQVTVILNGVDKLLQRPASEDGAIKAIVAEMKIAGYEIGWIAEGIRLLYQTHDQGVRHRPVALNALVEEAVEFMRPRWRMLAESPGMDVIPKLDLAQSLPAMTGVEGQIRKAVLCLLVRATNSMLRSGEITIRTIALPLAIRGWARAKEGQALLASPAVALEITDAGVGMDKTAGENLLSPYHITGSVHVSGLELAIVEAVMKNHSGQIEIDSQVGRQTMVRLIFPATSRSNAEAENPPAEPGHRCLRVLVVDDEFSLRSLLKDMLETRGHTVTVAEDGEAGVDIFREAHHRGETFDVVVTDYEMPKRNGLELARIVKELFPSTPVILFSGSYVNSGDAGDLLPLVDCYLTKPASLSKLHEVVVALASRKPADLSGKGATGSPGEALK